MQPQLHFICKQINTLPRCIKFVTSSQIMQFQELYFLFLFGQFLSISLCNFGISQANTCWKCGPVNIASLKEKGSEKQTLSQLYRKTIMYFLFSGFYQPRKIIIFIINCLKYIILLSLKKIKLFYNPKRNSIH